MTSRIDYNNPVSSGKLGLPYHYEMLSDAKRVTPFARAIRRISKGKRVFESGIGSGVMSILSAKAGAKKVYAAEIDPDIAAFAQSNIIKNGLRDVITILDKDTRDVSLGDIGGEKVDVAIAENLSTWEVSEPEIEVMNHINRSLIKADGVRIPETISNYFELAHADYRFEEAIELRTYYFQFSGVASPEILSEKTLFSEIDLKKINPMKTKKSVMVRVAKSGVLNCVRLTSPIKVFDAIAFDSSDSLMPPVIVPLEEDVAVRAGSTVTLTFEYGFSEGWNHFSARAERP